MEVKQFVNEFKTKNIKNTAGQPNAVNEFIKQTLDIKTYIPFIDKREIIKVIIEKNVIDDDGAKHIDSISQYVDFVVAMLISHTDLTMSANPLDDYDALSESGLLEPIIEKFRKDYTECDVLLKMALADELADNNLNVIVGKFLNGLLEKIDIVANSLKNVVDKVDLQAMLDQYFNEEDIAKIKKALDKYIK